MFVVIWLLKKSVLILICVIVAVAAGLTAVAFVMESSEPEISEETPAPTEGTRYKVELSDGVGLGDK